MTVRKREPDVHHEAYVVINWVLFEMRSENMRGRNSGGLIKHSPCDTPASPACI